MATNLTIRDAAEADLPAIVEIYNHSIASRTANANRDPVSVESRREWFYAHSPERRPLWVAVEGERVIGWIGLADFLPRYAYHITAELSLYVAPDRQQQGLGAVLMERLIAACPGIGVENLISLIFAKNAGSIRLHEKMGFDRWGYMPQVTELDDIRRDVVIMGRCVRSPA
ncbi:Putative phosphinothricin acetyltransferase YwnH [Pirellulimonas nuda]|uniref:Phosphinothricin acetyltransferase YwnH n=1 Tax=Pirellulimonas nuda TaxID=2528009 RepID=A0A518DIA8_9BACT|nr:GNAT family N-acetyltransferase [Pirellulimonas nuda]QDU91214.1 Putative phosphinothricin acetyltransferase YwnH [Pirellulimonas nuda]